MNNRTIQTVGSGLLRGGLAVLCSLLSTRHSALSTQHSALVALLALLLVSASAPEDLDDLVRRGNAAFQRGDYESAIACYNQAEDRITDPGLISFNKAAALYRLGDFRQAELHYRRCLEEARKERRSRVLYDLGNVLLRESKGEDAHLLDQTIELYEQCLRRRDVPPTLKEDVRYNLQLARTLRLKAKEKEKERPPQPTGSDDGQRGEERKPSPRPKNGADPSVAAEPSPEEKGIRGDKEGRDGKPIVSSKLTPGNSNIAPVPDKEELVPLPPGDAAAHLQRAAERIANEQKKHRRRAVVPPSRNVLDW